MALRYVADFAEAYLRMGREPFRAAHPHAVLLNAGLDRSAADADSDLRTSIITGVRWSLIRAMARSAIIPRSAPTRPTGAEVIVIAKRRSAAFRSQVTIGRGLSADISFAWPKLSKRHGYFTRVDDGRYSYTDAGSTNGTFVDGRRLDAGVPYVLPDKARIAFGPYCFAFFGPDAFCELVAERAGAG